MLMTLATQSSRHELCDHRRGFTLIESLMACGILLIIVVAVTSAVTAGQAHAFHAQQRIAGTLAAEEWMGRLEVLDYHALTAMHQVEEPSTMLDAQGGAFPESFRGVGREVWVSSSYVATSSPNVRINGKLIRVRSFDSEDRTLADIRRFLPDPQGDTVSAEEAEILEAGGGSGGGLLGGLLRRLRL
jgi:prepilin-type N-terminal cleavage/methylation domain-containing protein